MKRAALTPGMHVAVGHRTSMAGAARYVVVDATPWTSTKTTTIGARTAPSTHTLPDGSSIAVRGRRAPSGTGVLLREHDGTTHVVENLTRILAPWDQHLTALATASERRADAAARSAVLAAAARDRHAAAQRRASLALGRPVTMFPGGRWSVRPDDVEALLDALEALQALHGTATATAIPSGPVGPSHAVGAA